MSAFYLGSSHGEPANNYDGYVEPSTTWGCHPGSGTGWERLPVYF